MHAEQPERPLRLHLPLRRESASLLREALRDYLDIRSVPVATLEDVLIAAEEACANAIMHSGAVESGLELKAQVVDHEVIVEVSDQGCGFDHAAYLLLPPADPLADHGRGLFMIDQLMDRVRPAV